MTNEQKALKLCVKYARLQNTKKRIRRIHASVATENLALCTDGGDQQNCFDVYYNELKASALSKFYDRQLRARIKACSYCGKVHRTKQMKNKVSHAIGVTKRQILLLGRKAAK